MWTSANHCHVYLCVYPYSSSYARYFHPADWFQEQTDKNLGNSGICAIRAADPVNTGTGNTFEEDDHGNVAAVILPEDNRVDFTYNHGDRLVEVRDALGNRISYGYDVEGNRTSEDIHDPQGTLRKSLDFTYDPYNRLKRIVTPTGDYTEYTYDERGNRTAVRDFRDRTTTLAYDALMRLKSVTQPLSTVTAQAFDSQNHLTSVVDPKGNATEYPTDDFGRRAETTSPDTGTTTYLYDEADNLVQQVDGKGTVINYTYDALNRLTGVQFPSEPGRDIAYTYDSTSVTFGIGRLTGRTDPSGTYAFHYDAQGNLSREEKTVGGVLYIITHNYDRNNALSSVTYPSGRVVTYTRDAAHRISQVDTTLSGNTRTLASSITYLPFGGITGLAYGNGLYLLRDHDNQYRITSIEVAGMLDLTYQHYPDGSVQSVEDTLSTGSGVLETSGTYTYEAGSNRLDQIEGAAVTDFASDPNGNLTSAGTRAFVHDPLNQLVRVLDGGSLIAEYTYNASGQRIGKVTPAGTTVYHYDARGRLIAETDEEGQTLVEYIYLGEELLAMARPDGAIYYFHNDHLGTPRVLTNETGTPAWKASYSPFGLAQVLLHTVENPFRFQGQYYDSETGYHYNYHRYYDPKTGRYLTPDPIGLAGGINPYVYVDNDPVNWVDPLGLFMPYVHSRITFRLLSQYGASFALAGPVIRGNLDVDKPSNQLNNYQHGMRDFWECRWRAVERSKSFQEEQLQHAIEAAKACDYEQSFYELGRGLHSVQDEVAHDFADFLEHFAPFDPTYRVEDAFPSQSSVNVATKRSQAYVDEYIKRLGFNPFGK